MPWPRALNLWRQGFLRESSVIYGFDQNNPEFYLSDYQRFARTVQRIPQEDAYLDNKLLFATLAGSLVRIPKTYALIVRGRIVQTDSSFQHPDPRQLLELAARRGKLVIKPVGGGGGSDIRILEYIGDSFRINNSPIDASAFVELVGSLCNHMVCEYISQAAWVAEIFPGTLNTLRILTMIDPHNGEPFIAIAIHRFGRHSSYPVDNWTQGGLSTEIDLDTGTLGSGASYPMTGRLEWYDCHPDTGAQIKGVRNPRWDEIKAGILNLAGKLPFLRYVGWDVAVMDDGFVVVEGNSNTDVNLLQLHRPLLRDPRVRGFYLYYKVI